MIERFVANNTDPQLMPVDQATLDRLDVARLREGSGSPAPQPKRPRISQADQQRLPQPSPDDPQGGHRQMYVCFKFDARALSCVRTRGMSNLADVQYRTFDSLSGSTRNGRQTAQLKEGEIQRSCFLVLVQHPLTVQVRRHTRTVQFLSFVQYLGWVFQKQEQ